MNSVFCTCCENVFNYKREIYALKKGKFSRDRKMTMGDLTNYTIINNGKTTALEADEFILEKYGDWEMTMSKQNISQQRMFLDPQIFKDMNYDSLIEIYTQNESTLNKFKGYYVCGGDSTIVELPNHVMTRNEWNVPDDSLNYTNPTRARASGFYDLKNEFMLDSVIDEINIGERELVFQNIENVSHVIDFEKTISIYDRGYPSIELFLAITEKKGKFIVRLKDTDYKKVRNNMKKNDEWVKIPLDKIKTNKIKNPEIRKKAEKKHYLKARIVNITLPNGKVETLITNLPKKIANKDELNELYAERWKIETNFDVLKNKLDIENFSGIKRIIIEQDFYSQIFMHNLLNEYKMQINKNNKNKKEEESNYKEYKVNVNILAGKLKGFLLKILYTDDLDEKRKINEYILRTAEKHMQLVKKKNPHQEQENTGKINTPQI